MECHLGLDGGGRVGFGGDVDCFHHCYHEARSVAGRECECAGSGEGVFRGTSVAHLKARGRPEAVTRGWLRSGWFEDLDG